MKELILIYPQNKSLSRQITILIMLTSALAKLAIDNPACCVGKAYVGADFIMNKSNEIIFDSVGNGSPAGNAGILAGDIVVSIDGQAIESKYDAFKIYDSKYPGNLITVTVKRNGSLINTQFQLQSHYFLNVVYALIDLVYQDKPIRLAVIPGEINFNIPGLNNYLKKQYDALITHHIGAFESNYLYLYRGHNNFTIIDRQKIKTIFDEFKFQDSGLVEGASRLKIGNMLGATHFISFDISSYIAQANKIDTITTLRLIEVESGKVIATSIYTEKGQEPLDLVQVDLMDYLNNKIAKISSIEGKAMAAYDSIRRDVSTQASLDILANNVIPAYKNLTEEIRAIRPNTEELNIIHNLSIEGITLRYEAFKEMEIAVRNRNISQFHEANEKIKQGLAKIDQYKDALSASCRKHNVVINN
jgi:hypothetical protein